MSETFVGKGSCLCGEIKVIANTVKPNLGACHCGMCRKWGGGPFMALECETDVSFEGEENISRCDTSAWAERAFCKKCGTHLFYRLKGNNRHMLSVGLFENTEKVIFDHQIFIDKKPGYYCFSNKTDDMTEAEVFSKHGS